MIAITVLVRTGAVAGLGRARSEKIAPLGVRFIVYNCAALYLLFFFYKRKLRISLSYLNFYLI
jgi:hypothetical protein